MNELSIYQSAAGETAILNGDLFYAVGYSHTARPYFDTRHVVVGSVPVIEPFWAVSG
jgi:hypothetical protein